jgi:hypothetical protein
MKTVLVIDPPSGWQYGFPKPYINPNNYSKEKWLRVNGYPRKLINQNLPSSHYNAELTNLEYAIELDKQRKL